MMRKVYGERQLHSLFAGFGMTLAVGSLWTAVWWSMYAKTKQVIYSACQPLLVAVPASQTPKSWWQSVIDSMRDTEDNVLVNSASSMLTSAVTAVVFNPFLIIRTNLQVTPNGRLIPVIRDLYRKGGLKYFWNGTILSIGACIIEGALASTTYEQAKLWADTTNSKSA
jgi:hypothetical protein